MKFYTADTHFNHASIIDMSKRPFRSVHQMNEAMITRWNERVTDKDEIYFLGDFAFKALDAACEIFVRLAGQKHLIVGNHDKTGIHDWSWVSINQTTMVHDGDERIFLSHYPVLEWPGYYRGVRHFFGHVHGNKRVPGATDVGVDLWNYQPITAKEAIAGETPLEPVARKATMADFGGEATRQALERADNWMVPWERSVLADALDRAANQTLDDILNQRVDQAGCR